MTDDQRERIAPIPANLATLLNDLQLLGIRRMEGFGWDLRFVRRQALPAPIPVIADPSGHQLAVVDQDGRLETNHGLSFRP